MFTGIIESLGKIRSLQASEVWIDAPFASELVFGQSVACDGVCLTVVDHDDSSFLVQVLEETKRMTRFGELRVGSVLNLERALKANDRLDGHIVQAHVEGIGVLQDVHNEVGKDDTWILRVSVPPSLMKYMILKGIIVLNGIALTITHVDDNASEISVAIIPHTWENTNLHTLQKGDQINVETDVLAKYVERLLKHSS